MRRLTNSFASNLRSVFWPIQAGEHNKLVPMFLMFFLIVINYTILRNMKDALNVTASGAKAIPFIKVWIMLPAAILATIAFTKLANHFSQEKVFYITISFFLAFYIIWTLLLYPFRDYLHPNRTADFLMTVLPPGLEGFVNMLRNWTLTSFYLMAELWSTMVMSVLFWGFANEVTKVGEAKRFYSFFNIAGNAASIIAGQIPGLCVYLCGSFLPGSNEDSSLFFQLGIVIACGLITIFIYRWMNGNVLNGPEFEEFHANKLKMKKKKRLGIKESFSYLSNSRYLVCIAVMVVGYNLVINLVEVIWKDQLQSLYPNRTEFNTYIGHMTTITGLLAMLITVFIPKLIDRFGWTKTALITPLSMLITGISFFGLLLCKGALPGELTILFWSTTPLALIVFFGALQNALTKASKYSLFDTTKEMTFIPLEHEVKLKGKAAIDGIGSRLGKSGGSVFYQGLLAFLPTLSACAPIVALILSVVIAGWIAATKSLGTQFEVLVSHTPQPEVTIQEKEEQVPIEQKPAISVAS